MRLPAVADVPAQGAPEGPETPADQEDQEDQAAQEGDGLGIPAADPAVIPAQVIQGAVSQP